VNIHNNEHFVFGDNAINLQKSIYTTLDKCRVDEFHGQNVVFVSSTLERTHALYDCALRLIHHMDASIIKRDGSIIATEWFGTFHFMTIRAAASKARGLGIDTAYIDLSNEEITKYQDILENIFVSVVFSQHNKQTGYDKQINKPKTINHRWCRFARWLRQRWKNTLEVFGRS